jgi:hypothetical protein
MSAALPATIVTPGVQKQVSLVNIPNVQAIKLTNGTPFDLTISGFGIQGAMIIPAGLEYMLYAHIKNAGYINILAVNNVGAVGNGAVNIVVFDNGESIPPGVWPVSVPTQTVSTTVTASTTLVNTGNPPLTNVITIQPSDASGNTFVADNSGNVTITSDNAGVLVQLLKLIAGASPSVTIGSASITTTIAGTTAVGVLTIGGGATFTGGDLTLGTHNIVSANNINTTNVLSNSYEDASGNGAMVITAGSVTRIQNATQVAFQVPGGTTVASVNSTGMSSNSYSLTGSSGTYGMNTNGMSRISTGTYASSNIAHATNHNLGATPSLVIITGGSSAGTATGGADTYTATQFTSVEGANGVTMRFVAIKF